MFTIRKMYVQHAFEKAVFLGMHVAPAKESVTDGWTGNSMHKHTDGRRKSDPYVVLCLAGAQKRKVYSRCRFLIWIKINKEDIDAKASKWAGKMLPGNCISVPDTLFYMKY